VPPRRIQSGLPQTELAHLPARIAALSLVVDDAEIVRRTQRVSGGSVRTTAVVRLRGRAAEGVGEDVTFQLGDLLGPGEVALLRERVGWDGARTLGDLWSLLDTVDLFERSPPVDAVRAYRRWAIEAAALDLALKQAGTTFAELVGRRAEPVRFVASVPPERAALLPPGVRLKLDADALTPGLPVEVVDFKGAGDATLVNRVRVLYPDALLEDPPVVPAGARLSWDIGVRSQADLDCRATPAAVNVKPARVGSFRGVLELYAACAARGIGLYGGGQWEIGPGRGQAQLLAALFHADAPNDLAPAAYNEDPLPATMPASPLQVRPRLGFGLAGDEL